MGAELALQVVHAFVVLPRTEKGPASHASMRASWVVEHCVVILLPAEVCVHELEHGVSNTSVPYTEGMPAAEKVPVPHGVHTRSNMPPAAAE